MTTRLTGRSQEETTIPTTRPIAYRIMALTSGFKVWISGRLTTSKTGEGTVRSAKAIAAPPSLVQKTCSTSLTRTVTMMFPVPAERNRTRNWSSDEGAPTLTRVATTGRTCR